MQPTYATLYLETDVAKRPAFTDISGQRPQRPAMNDPKFNAALKAAGPQDQAIYDSIVKNFNDTFQAKEPK